MNTLYVVGILAGDWDQITLRAQRILREVGLVVAPDADQARQMLTSQQILTPVAALTEETLPDSVRSVLHTLAAGDAAILTTGWSAVPAGPASELIRQVIARGLPVVPIPGGTLPIAALVLSGLPTDSFAYLGQLPLRSEARRALLSSLAGERRTLLSLAAGDQLPAILNEMSEILGSRPLVVTPLSRVGDAPSHASGSRQGTWRGALAAAILEPPAAWQGAGPWALAVGGHREQPPLWEEDRLRAEIGARLQQGWGAKHISQALSARGASGWPRREIYRLATEMSQATPGRSAGA